MWRDMRRASKYGKMRDTSCLCELFQLGRNDTTYLTKTRA